jgi:hypothetical protein
MHDAAIIEIVQRHAMPLDLETAGQRLLDAVDHVVSLVLIARTEDSQRCAWTS